MIFSHLNNEENDDISSESLKELNKIEKENIPKSNKWKLLYERLHECLSVKKLSTNLQTTPIRILDNYLRFFYGDLKTKKKNITHQLLFCFCAAINRHFLEIRQDVS